MSNIMFQWLRNNKSLSLEKEEKNRRKIAKKMSYSNLYNNKKINLVKIMLIQSSNNATNTNSFN